MIEIIFYILLGILFMWIEDVYSPIIITEDDIYGCLVYAQIVTTGFFKEVVVPKVKSLFKK
jgi:hypothetical protein